MAGYSGTPLPQKLGLKPAARLLLINAPEGFELILAPLPVAATITRRPGKHPFDVILLFCKDLATLEKNFEPARARMLDHAGLWIAWPKKSSGIPTDLTENLIRDLALAAGLVDNKVCAIDNTWSGLRLVIRLKDRAPKS